MSFFEITLGLLLFVTVIGPLVPRVRLPIEVVLVLGSLFVSFIPGLPAVQLKADVVFQVFLPPILFAAAYFTSWRDFKANARPIALLAFGLVLFTASAVAVTTVMLIPGFTWAHGFLLGAIVSPPDASAATAITRKLGFPRRLITVIEGESLLNDATALVIYRFALTAILTGTFSFWQASWQFGFVALGGFVVGMVVSGCAIAIWRVLKDSRAEVLLSILTAYGCYIIAEHVGASGVISAVTGGLHFGRTLPTRLSAQTRIEAKATWDALLFVINGLVFTLIGLQLPAVVRDLDGTEFLLLGGYALVVCLVVILVRLIWVFPATYLPRRLNKSLARRDPAPPWTVVAALGWTGMRGIVSLAAVLAVPELDAHFSPFAHRDVLVFITYVVILVTLLLPALTLPRMKGLLRLRDGGEHQREEALARIAATEAVVARVADWRLGNRFPPALVEQFHHRFERRLRTFRSNVEENAYSELHHDDLAIRRMTRESIEAERKALAELRRQGAIHDEVFHLIAQELDIEDLRLSTQRL